MAAAIPAAVAFKPPVRAPKNPSSLDASIAPCAKAWPNPLKGMVAPAPASSTRGSYRPKELAIAPNIRKLSNICAGVNLELSSMTWPITHIRPPITNAYI